MSTIAELLAAQGPPPKELCLDWAWQIVTARENGVLPAGWDDLQFDDREDAAGGVQVVPKQSTSEIGEHELSEQSLRLVEQLLTWADGGDAAESGSAGSDEVGRLDLRWRAAVERLSVTTRALAESFETSSSEQPAPALTSNSGPQRAETRNTRHKSLVPFVLAGTVLLAVLSGAVWMFVRSPVPETTFASNDAKAGDVPAALESVNSPLDSVVSEEQRLEFSEGTQSTNESVSTDPIVGVDALAEISNVSGIGVGGKDVGGNDLGRAEASADQPSDTGAIDLGSVAGSGRGAENGRGAGVEEDEDETAEANASVEAVDLMAEINRATTEASAETAELEVDVDSSDPWTLLLSPPLQTQKIAIDVDPRPRKPAWQLRLEVSEGLVVQPTAVQAIQGRDGARWLITESEQELKGRMDPDTPRTGIVVVAQLTSARAGAIRWNVFATSEDLPSLQIPLNPNALDAAQQALSVGSQRLQLAADQADAMSKRDGLKRRVRSAYREQRDRFREQLELGQRMLMMVAKANQMQGWADGAFAVHASLVDLAATDSVALLQFGQVDEAVAKAEVSEGQADES